MGNVLSHKSITISYDTWEPFNKQAEADLDKLVSMVKTKELLSHCGNVHLHFEEKGEIKGDKDED